MKRVGYVNKYKVGKDSLYGNVYGSAEEAVRDAAETGYSATVPVYDATTLKALIDTALTIAETRGEVHSAAALRFILEIAK